MDLRQLQNFLTVLDQKNISNAASLIRIAQPALSRQLRALEAEVGGDLLIRHRWGVTPTRAGEALAEHARKILEEVRKARDAVSAATTIPSGSLSVGVTSSVARIFLSRLAIAARKAVPQVKLELLEASSVDLQQRLTAGELDLAVFHLRERFPAFEAELLLTEPVVVAGAAGVFEPGSSTSMKELLRHDLVVTASSGRLRLLYEEAIARANAKPTTFLEVDSFGALLELLAEGVGLALLPYSTIHAEVALGRLSWAKLAPKPLTRRLHLARPADRIETPASAIMTRLLRELVEQGRETYQWA
jgi:LysR family nitrogen assimilation transcriptional regulator